MNIILEHTVTDKDALGRDTTSLSLKVAFCTNEKKVVRLLSMTTYNHKLNVSADITSIMHSHYAKEILQMVGNVNWNELYEWNKHLFRVSDQQLVIHDRV